MTQEQQKEPNEAQTGPRWANRRLLGLWGPEADADKIHEEMMKAMREARHGDDQPSKGQTPS